MVKRDKLMEWYLVGKLLIFYSVLSVGFGVGFWIVKRQNATELLVLGLFSVMAGAGLLGWGRRWVKIERRRQRAAWGDEEARDLLASEQPQPNAVALVLPCKIKLRPRWAPPILSFLVVSIITLTPLTILILNTPPVPFGLYVAIYGEFLFFFPVLTSALCLTSGWQTIIVTEDGLRIRGGQPLKIAWQDARLFAIYPATKHSQPPTRYELSGENAIVRWRRMPPGATWRLTKTPAPFDEYDRQMAALLALIAAKTGLPLYYLREPARGA
jgi:hypothetical protein